MQDQYEQHVVSAKFIPWHFNIIGKTEERFEIVEKTLWDEPQLRYELRSNKDVDLEVLFAQNQKARTLVEWSPFVVIVDDEERLGVYDPRFYRNGQSFLFEYIQKH